MRMAEYIGIDPVLLGFVEWNQGNLYPQPGSDCRRFQYDNFSVDVPDLSLKAARATAQSSYDNPRPSSA